MQPTTYHHTTITDYVDEMMTQIVDWLSPGWEETEADLIAELIEDEADRLWDAREDSGLVDALLRTTPDHLRQADDETTLHTAMAALAATWIEYHTAD